VSFQSGLGYRESITARQPGEVCAVWTKTVDRRL